MIDERFKFPRTVLLKILTKQLKRIRSRVVFVIWRLGKFVIFLLRLNIHQSARRSTSYNTLRTECVLLLSVSNCFIVNGGGGAVLSATDVSEKNQVKYL